jgi:hypothetical protein
LKQAANFVNPISVIYHLCHFDIPITYLNEKAWSSGKNPKNDRIRRAIKIGRALERKSYLNHIVPV